MAAPTQLRKGFAKKIASLGRPKTRMTISDRETRGLYLRAMPSGHKSFAVIARNKDGKQVWAVLGEAFIPGPDGADEPPAGTITLEHARQEAPKAIARIKAGEAAIPKAMAVVAPRTFGAVRDDFLKRHVRREGQGKPPLRSSAEIHRIFYGPKYARWILSGAKGEAPELKSAYIPETWDARPFVEVRRIDVTEMLDAVQDGGGSRQADAVLAQLSSMFNWYASRADDYVSPIVRGMKRTKAKEQARKRILTDAEIKTVWTAAKGTFGALVKVALLTGQRREKLASMRWEDITDGVWTIRTEEREKGNAERLMLPALVIEIIEALPQIAKNPFVFAGRGAKAIAGFSEGKAELDEAAPIPHWVIHDLRRTARSLMARARVDREVAERVLGHVIPGVEGVYDRHDYFEEKADALKKLAGLVALILAPPAENVVRMERASA